MSDQVQHKFGAAGGFLVGNPHSKGGIKAINKSTDQFLEMEGNEVVITAPAVLDNEKREFEGEMLTNRQILSRINVSGGGVSFEHGGEIPDEIYFYGNSYKYGGETLKDHQIINKINDCGCQHQEVSDLADEILAEGGLINEEITDLEISNENPLSNQLLRITGDTWNVHDFEDLYGEDLSTSRIFRHKRSGRLFKVVTPVVFVEDDYFAGKIYKTKSGQKLIDPNGKGRLYTLTEEGEPFYPATYYRVIESFGNEPGISTDINDYKNPYEINKAIERLIDSKSEDFTYTPEEKGFIMLYSGYGGLEKFGAEGKGLLYEYFTPDEVVKKMWGLAYKYGFGEQTEPSVLEPSVGTGNFLKYAPEHAYVVGNEINEYSVKICRILYPNAHIKLQSFEQNFIQKNLSVKSNISKLQKYDLVIGNPPYGKLMSKYIGMGEGDYTQAGNFTEYFISRGLDLLHPEGLLIFIVGAEQYNGGTLFLDSGLSNVKHKIFEKAMLVDAYRLPTKIFERTGVASEILVFKKY